MKFYNLREMHSIEGRKIESKKKRKIGKKWMAD